MRKNMIALLGSPSPMLGRIFAGLAARQLPLDFELDHICYRVETIERYQALKIGLLTYGTIESEISIAGRPIATFALRKPYQYQGRAIPCVELPAPKPGSRYAEGWEHGEFVVPDLPSFLTHHQHLPFDTRGMNKPLNPEACLQIDEKTAVKFHPLPLLKVIEEEKRLGLT